MIFLIILMMLGLALQAGAITFGVPDGEDHPYVGVAFFFNEQGTLLWPCSGTLLSDTVFLTAGHCTFATDHAIVLLESDLTGINGPSGCEDFDCFELNCDTFECYMSESIHPHPRFKEFNFPNTRDIGVVILDLDEDQNICPGGDAENCEFGRLPAEADPPLLDDLATQRGRKDTIIRTVGYGLNMVKPFPHHERKRYTSTSKVVNLRSHLTDGYNIHTSNNPGKGQGTGGSCFGDSGGPILYTEDSNKVVGVVSFGLNDNCKGADFAYRTDIEEALDFIQPFLD
jgi:hypothetical protein